jgi:hypothetical protein
MGAVGAMGEDAYLGKLVTPERFELPTFWFVARRSVQLSYGASGHVMMASSTDSTERAEWSAVLARKE